MDIAQAIPTAFTPNFANSTTSFSPAPPAHFAPSNQTNGGPVYKRRRPLYVGAGYSSRRRKAATSTGGMSKSQSEGALSSLASGSNSDGKRRRTEEDETEEDIPVASLDDVLVSAPIAPPASSSSTSNNSLSTEKAQDKLKSKPSLSRFTGTTTPAKPSPLWQVSKAGKIISFSFYFRSFNSHRLVDRYSVSLASSETIFSSSHWCSESHARCDFPSRCCQSSSENEGSCRQRSYPQPLRQRREPSGSR